MDDEYRTVAGATVHEIEVRRSRFLCALAPVDTEERAREVIAARRKAEPAARHHCHAFVLGADGRTQRSNDDGEPAGTAGAPMLEVLRRRELTNTVAVVTRYFGGVLLGAGGLIRAYGQAVADALDEAGTARYRRLRVLAVTVDYGRAGRMEERPPRVAVSRAGHVLRRAGQVRGRGPRERAGRVRALARRPDRRRRASRRSRRTLGAPGPVTPGAAP